MDVFCRDFLPGEQGQEVGWSGRGRFWEDASKEGKMADDFLWRDVFFPQYTEVHATVALAEALAVFIYKKRMMKVNR